MRRRLLRLRRPVKYNHVDGSASSELDPCPYIRLVIRVLARLALSIFGIVRIHESQLETLMKLTASESGAVRGGTARDG